jgi:hypothetical protein
LSQSARDPKSTPFARKQKALRAAAQREGRDGTFADSGATSAADVVEGSTGSGIVLAAGNLILPS